MAGSASFLKAILVPLFLALALYLLLALVILPFVRRHRTRYSQYLPMASTMPDFPTSWRTKLSDALYALFMPSTWGRSRPVVDGSGDSADDDLFDDEEGEGMVGFDPIDDRRREALDQRRSMAVEQRRLSRELEQGFKDDSEDDEEDERRRSLSR